MRNPWLCLTIVVTLGVGALVGTGGLIVLAFYDKQAPQALVAVVSSCFGALASFLVSPPRGSVGLPRRTLEG